MLYCVFGVCFDCLVPFGFWWVFVVFNAYYCADLVWVLEVVCYFIDWLRWIIDCFD